MLIIDTPSRGTIVERRGEASLTSGRAVALLTGLLLAALPDPFRPVHAQIPNVGGELEQRRPAERLRERPLPEEQDSTAPALELPPPPVQPPEAGLAGQLEVPLAGVRLLGSTQLSRDDVALVTEPYLRKGKVTTDELETIRLALTRIYVERGYRTSGVILPDQTPSANGNVIVFRAIEGRLGRIRVEGTQLLRPQYVEERLSLVGDAPLNVNALQERVQLLINDPSIAGVQARLGPGERLGEAELAVEVEEAPRFAIGLSLDNSRSPSVGEVQAGTHVTFRNFVGFGEQLRHRFQLTEGFRSHELELEFPVTANDTWLTGRYYISDSKVVESPFNSVNIVGKSRDLEIGIRHPIYRRPGKELMMGLVFEKRRSKTFLLDQPFSFSPGVQNGLSKVRPLRFWQSWLDVGRDHVLALRSVFSFGLDVFGTTVNPSPLPDGRFFSWLGQAQYVRRLGSGDVQLVLRANAQLAPEPLLPLEKFSLGGAYSVRGYRENQLVRDNGFNGSVELRVPVFRLPVPGLSKRITDGWVEVVPFFDYGAAWSAEGPTPDPKHIYSVGAGLRYSASPQAVGEVYFGHQLRNVPEPAEHSIQDSGIHFRIRVRYN